MQDGRGVCWPAFVHIKRQIVPPGQCAMSKAGMDHKRRATKQKDKPWRRWMSAGVVRAVLLIFSAEEPINNVRFPVLPGGWQNLYGQTQFMEQKIDNFDYHEINEWQPHGSRREIRGGGRRSEKNYKEKVTNIFFFSILIIIYPCSLLSR